MVDDMADAIIEVEFRAKRRDRFIADESLELELGERVLVEAEKGVDMGTVVGIFAPPESDGFPEKRVVRRIDGADLEQLARNRLKEFEALAICQERVRHHGLSMKLVGVEQQFDNKKLTFYFTAERRVDFRALVKDLAGIFKTRIEMRQIGVRDHAKWLGGYGNCGRGLCCATFVRDFEPVTLQMARDQNLWVNPAKMSGVCGRLMCCLMFERSFYLEMSEKLPIVGSKVVTERGKGRVMKRDLFREIVSVQYRDGVEEEVTVDQLEEERKTRRGPLRFLSKRKGRQRKQQ
jgi:cell fate regulator YaaT (PSP1 superfamily)